ncbi:hypothetical protein [Bradyrhizobium sp. RDI18]|uniref:hypothetical protein n=1 Tax=Bradyrhizobium sp. RDI18 TaxID=3367400 RepID=UPI00371720ED
MINTHMHPDHVMGNAAFKAPNLEFVGHYKLPAALYARKEKPSGECPRAPRRSGNFAKGTEIIPPTVLIKDTLEPSTLAG